MIPLELIEQFARGNGSVFVGAGLSRGAGLPDWKELIEPLAEYVGCSKETSFPDIAQYYENLTSRQALVDRLLQTLGGQESRPTEVHKKLVNLPVPRIFTTNFDSLLEEAFHEQRLPFRQVLTAQDLAFMNNAQRTIVKLHGDLQRTETLVITAGDYESYLSKHPGIANLLGMDLHSRTVLFLGYSFSDNDLRMILTQVGREAGEARRNQFTVQPNPSELAKIEFNRRRIQVIELQAKDAEITAALCSWLEEFIRSVRESAVRQTAAFQLFTTISFINSNLKPRSDEFELLGRKDEVARALDGLLSRYPLIAIKGFAGVGKTRLATEVVRACSQKLTASDARSVVFEYIVWISAEDKLDSKGFLDDVLNVIATTTNNPAIKLEQDPKKKMAKVEQLLKGYKVLVIVDNFETVEDDSELVAWLEQLPYPSKALITTRDSRSGMERIAAWTVNLKGLETEQAVELLRRQFASRGLTEQTLYDLARVTGCNPQAMKLALGLVQGGIADLEDFIKQLQKDPHKIFQELLSGSWDRLLDSARQILRVAPLFTSVRSIRRDALQAATELLDAEFCQGLDQCLRFGLLEEDHDRYVIHPITRAFARGQLDAHKDWEQEARRRCTKYFLKFVAERVVRPELPPYWNALVSVRMVESMGELNLEWPIIQQVIAWADEDRQDEDLIDLVMLLVHYMDTQFLNLERLKYVEKAVAALHRLGRYEEEALLRIDALGWTYVEVLELEKAREHITQGLEIARGEDLRALGLAWTARVRVERMDPARAAEDFEQAGKLIREALAIRCSAWIRFRVNMAAGDIALKQGDAKAALDFYQDAAHEADSYGGEGYGYQTTPRIGLALLRSGQIPEAERKFQELSSLEQIPIGKLYGEYGLALVMREKKEPEKAQAMLNDVKAKLDRYTGPNLLRRLVEEQETRMQGPQGAEK